MKETFRVSDSVFFASVAVTINLYPLNRGFAQLPNGRFRVGFSENRGSGDDNLNPGGDHRLNVFPIDAAVDLDADVQLPLDDHLAQPSNFIERLRNERLPAETRIHRHH